VNRSRESRGSAFGVIGRQLGCARTPTLDLENWAVRRRPDGRPRSTGIGTRAASTLHAGLRSPGTVSCGSSCTGPCGSFSTGLSGRSSTGFRGAPAPPSVGPAGGGPRARVVDAVMPRSGHGRFAYIRSHPGRLPASGRPRLVGIQLPAGRAVSDGLPLWRTQRSVAHPVELAERLAAAFPRTGPWPVLWPAWDQPAGYIGTLNGPSQIGRVDAARFLAGRCHRHRRLRSGRNPGRVAQCSAALVGAAVRRLPCAAEPKRPVGTGRPSPAQAGRYWPSNPRPGEDVNRGS
jgi:hypothetical protein